MTLDPFEGFNPDEIPPLPQGRYTFTYLSGVPPLHSCDLCGAVVGRSHRDRHAMWHWSLHLSTVHTQFHWHPDGLDRPMVDGDLYFDHLTAVGSVPPERPDVPSQPDTPPERSTP